MDEISASASWIFESTTADIPVATNNTIAKQSAENGRELFDKAICVMSLEG
jgi:hypothetical protein